MIVVPIAVLALIILTMIFSGVIVLNLMIGNYLLALGCLAAVCVLGIILGFLIGKLGTELDGTTNREHVPSRLDLSEDVLKNLRELPEGVNTRVAVPPLHNIRTFYEEDSVDSPIPLATVSESTEDVTASDDEGASGKSDETLVATDADAVTPRDENDDESREEEQVGLRKDAGEEGDPSPDASTEDIAE